MAVNITVEEPEDIREGLDGLSNYPTSHREHHRQRSRSFIDTQHLSIDTGKDASIRPKSFSFVHQRKRSPSIRLHVSIPLPQLISDSGSPVDDDTTPQSEVLATPASATSAIAGVVDLTRDTTTTSVYPVAQGGLSDIYMGEWHQRDEHTMETQVVTVAIKLLRVSTSGDESGAKARKKLNREVYVWHRLEHPNVVKLFGTSYHMSGRPSMVMQWYKNGSAAEYLARKNPNADRLQLILDVARGLEYLHTMPSPIVHADLKGNNVLITDCGAAALCDFGLSEVMEDLLRPDGLTRTNPSVGPLRWQAPELADDEVPTTQASDVWSFGCTAFELLTSRIPYSNHSRDLNILRDMQKQIKPPAPDDEVLLDAFGPRVRALLDSCWSFNSCDRPTMSEVRIELEAICASRDV